MRSSVGTFLLGATIIALTSCMEGNAARLGGASGDASALSLDAARLDGSSCDESDTLDAEPLDTTPIDTGNAWPIDGSWFDAALVDAALVDAALVDAASLDAASLDAASLDAASLDAASLDAGPVDATRLDAAARDAAAADVGIPDSGVPNSCGVRTLSRLSTYGGIGSLAFPLFDGRVLFGDLEPNGMRFTVVTATTSSLHADTSTTIAGIHAFSAPASLGSPMAASQLVAAFDATDRVVRVLEVPPLGVPVLRSSLPLGSHSLEGLAAGLDGFYYSCSTGSSNTSTSSLRTFDFSVLSQPVERAPVVVRQCGGFALDRVHRRLLSATYDVGLTVFDLAQPAAPAPFATPISGTVSSVATNGELIVATIPGPSIRAPTDIKVLDARTLATLYEMPAYGYPGNGTLTTSNILVMPVYHALQADHVSTTSISGLGSLADPSDASGPVVSWGDLVASGSSVFRVDRSAGALHLLTAPDQGPVHAVVPGLTPGTVVALDRESVRVADLSTPEAPVWTAGGKLGFWQDIAGLGAGGAGPAYVAGGDSQRNTLVYSYSCGPDGPDCPAASAIQWADVSVPAHGRPAGSFHIPLSRFDDDRTVVSTDGQTMYAVQGNVPFDFYPWVRISFSELTPPTQLDATWTPVATYPPMLLPNHSSLIAGRDGRAVAAIDPHLFVLDRQGSNAVLVAHAIIPAVRDVAVAGDTVLTLEGPEANSTLFIRRVRGSTLAIDGSIAGLGDTHFVAFDGRLAFLAGARTLDLIDVSGLAPQWIERAPTLVPTVTAARVGRLIVLGAATALTVLSVPCLGP